MLSFLRRSFPEFDYSNLIYKLEQNNKVDISALLFESEKIDYLPITYTMLEKMAKPSGSINSLKLYMKHLKGKYELAIFEVPWDQSDIKFLPLILDRKVGKIVGVMLPFNELVPTLTKNAQRQIQKLSLIWTGFIMQVRFGIKLNDT